MAMEAEAAPLRASLGAAPAAPPDWASSLPVRLAVADHAGVDVVLVTNGTDPRTGVDCIGSTAAALATQVALDHTRTGLGRRPDLVLTVGTAGGWNRAGASIGDVYLAWDRFFDALGRADLPAADLRAHADTLGCRRGVVTTGDSLDESPEDAARILASGAEVKEMEAAAVAWIGSLHDVPVGAVKAITDLVDSPVATAEQFSANLATAADALQRTTLALLARLGVEIGADV